MASAPGQTRFPQWQRALLERHQLDEGYLETALTWFAPLACSLAEQQDVADRPLLVALNGCQGSGKSTLSDYLCTSWTEQHGLNAITLSLDDFYLSRTERQALANSVHPLFATRGVPGTHDMVLLKETLAQLLSGAQGETVAIPRFDKSTDDRLPYGNWNRVTAPVQMVLLEGWCLGARPEPVDTLSKPINELERVEDPAGLWRGYCNEVLKREFQALHPLVDQWVMLSAPSFDCVFDWRREQERKLAATLSAQQAGRLMNDDALHRFIQHFERITLRCLKDLPGEVNHLLRLDEVRAVTAYHHRPQANRLQRG